VDIVFETSRTGFPTCRAGKLLLHSAYDPYKEAERFLDASLAQGSLNTAIVLGPGLDYLSPLIRQRHPGCLILRIQLHPGFRGREEGPAVPTWYPDSREGLAGFLSAWLDEDGLAGIRVLEWEASSRAWPAEANAARREIKAALDALASSAATLKTFGPSWIANACRNFLLLEDLLAPQTDGAAIVVAAAGPSLEASLDLLETERKGYRLLAVSSALSTLASRGIEPDLVVASDGGFWSRYHLYPLAAAGGRIASPLTALPSACLGPGLAFLPLVQAGFPEPELASLLGSGLGLASHGTVSGTAIHLAASLGRGPIILAGLDLAVLESRAHARPHGFDALVAAPEGRLKPRETILHDRIVQSNPELLGEGPWRTSRSLVLYARALAAEAGRPPLAGRLYRLNPSPLGLDGFRILDDASFSELVHAGPRPRAGFTHHAPAPRSEREVLLGLCLKEWMRKARAACTDLAEGHKPGEAGEMLKTIDLPDWAAACRAIDEGRDPRPSAKALNLACEKFLNGLGRRLLSWTT
jgi:hypothetical protein